MDIWFVEDSTKPVTTRLLFRDVKVVLLSLTFKFGHSRAARLRRTSVSTDASTSGSFVEK